MVTADADGFITVYSVDADGAYFVRLEFEVSLLARWQHGGARCRRAPRTRAHRPPLLQAHNKGVSSLVMLSEGTLLSGGEKDRRIIAWDSLQNYKKITETKVSALNERPFLRLGF